MKYAIQTVSMIYQNGEFLTAIITHEYAGAITLTRVYACNAEEATKITRKLAAKNGAKVKNCVNGDMMIVTTTWYRFMGWMK